MSTFQPIQFVDADAQRIENDMIEAYYNATGQILYPGDPRRIFLLQLLPMIVALKNDINFTANQNLLPFAIGDVLDGLGDRMNVKRLAAQPARTLVRLTLSAIQPNDVVIPQGTRITPDGQLYFETIADLVIAPGQSQGDVVASSTGSSENNGLGLKYNGFVAGQINIIVDPIPFVASVVNLDTSIGGSDEEDDESYRERQRLAPDSFSIAGPSGAYKYFAKSADVNIADVAATSPVACEVNLYVLMKNGELPDTSILEKVLAEVNPDHRRPLTDYVQVFAPTVVNYDIELTYYIASERSAEVAAIRSQIEGDSGAIEQYVAWQHEKLGRSVSPDSLLARLYGAGAFRVVITSPVYAAINSSEVAKLGNTSITFGGLI